MMCFDEMSFFIRQMHEKIPRTREALTCYSNLKGVKSSIRTVKIFREHYALSNTFIAFSKFFRLLFLRLFIFSQREAKILHNSSRLLSLADKQHLSPRGKHSQSLLAGYFGKPDETTARRLLPYLR